jgi:hypothetical protein
LERWCINAIEHIAQDFRAAQWRLAHQPVAARPLNGQT